MQVIPVKWKAPIFPLVDGLSFKSSSAHVPDVLLFSSLVDPPRVPQTSSALHPRGFLDPALTDPARWSGGVPRLTVLGEYEGEAVENPRDFTYRCQVRNPAPS